jgi:hypothetical protein
MTNKNIIIGVGVFLAILLLWIYREKIWPTKPKESGYTACYGAGYAYHTKGKCKAGETGA